MDFKDFSLPIPPAYSDFCKSHGEFKLGIRPESFNVGKSEKKGWVPFHCLDIQEKGEGVRILFLRSRDKHNELKAVGTFPEMNAGETLWVELPQDKISIYDVETGRIVG